jgi:Protein of unknown function (DUF2975)
MNASNAGLDTQDRLQVASRWMGAFCAGLVLLLPLALAAYWALGDTGALAARANLPAAAVAAPLQGWQRLVGALLGAAALAPLLAGLWQARKCFVQFAHGQVFTQQAARHLKHFAAWMLVAAVAGVVMGAAMSALLTWNNPPGQRHLALAIGTDQAFTVFFAGMVWLMAAVIAQGQAMAEENASFV